jgi:nucleoid-associated protein YgaU
MRDPFDPTQPGDSEIPAAYTYLGQFIDHDITLEATSSGPGGDITALFAPGVAPLPVQTIRQVLRNVRKATLDLDSLYEGSALRDPNDADKMKLGTVVTIGGRPPHVVDDFHDLPREGRSNDHDHDRAAEIGDPRNDENLIVAQLHVAFLRAHNALVDQGKSFNQARRILRQHFQHLVLHDFLPRVADPAIVNTVVQNGPQHYDPPEGQFFLPLEYAVAAYRFGHTMVRNLYTFNLNFPAATLHELFTFTALSGQLGDFDTLPEFWIVEWQNLVDLGNGTRHDKARRFDTKLVEPGLFQLQDTFGVTLDPADPTIPDVEKDKRRLAVRNLLRGYLLRMPTGQALAGALGLTPLTASEVEAAASSPDQVAALQAGGFSSRTPLWYYLLAEAAHPNFGNGQHLGPVGSTIVAEVLVGLAQRSRNSILTDPDWTGPTLPGAQPGTFELPDLLRFAGVLDVTAGVTCQYTVVAGDTLGGIAQRLYGDSTQWPRIFNANLDQISDPDQIFPGQVLRIPATAQYTVVAGDTLGSIAQQFYGASNQWPRIFGANRDQLSDPDVIVPGQLLCIP